MFDTSDNYKSKVYNVNHYLKVYINDVEIESKYILDCRPSSTLFTNGEIELGSTPSQTVELKLYKSVVPATINKVEIKSGITGEIVPLGVYNVDKAPTSDDYTVTLSLADNMIKFEFNYDGSKLVNDSDGKVKIIRVLQDICSKANVELGSTSFLNMNKVISVYDNTVSARTYLSYIAEQAGGFAFIGRDGKLYIKSFKYALGKKIGEGKSIVIEKTNNLKAKAVIKGEHSQKTTEGRNLFNPKISTKTTFGVTVTQEGKHRIKLNGQGSGGWQVRFDTIHKFEKGKSYTVTIRKISGSCTQAASDIQWSFLFYPETSKNTHATFKPSDTVINRTFKAEESNTAPYIWIGWKAGLSVVGTNSVFDNLILEISIVEGNTAKDYEDYTGCKPSPSTDYLQEVETAGKVINIFDYITTLRTEADGLKNTLNEDGSITTEGVPAANYTKVCKNADIIDILEDGETYTLFQEDKQASLLYIQVAGLKADGTYTMITSSQTNKTTFTVDKKTYSKYLISIQTGTTAKWGTDSRTISNKYMLCRGRKIISFSKYNQRCVQIIKSTKNLLNLSEQTINSNGVTGNYKNGNLKLKGTLNNYNWCYAYLNSENAKNLYLKKGTYTCSISAMDKQLEVRMQLEDGTTSSFWLAYNALKKTVTFDKDITGCTIVYHHAEIGDDVDISLNIQIEEGKTVSDFSSPQSEVYTLPIQKEMLENDYIDDVEHHEWDKLILTGEENWYCESNGRMGYLVQYLPNAYKKTVKTSDLLGNLCNSYIEKTPSQTWNGAQGFCIDPAGSLRIWDDTYSKTSDLAGFKAMLAEKYNSGNPVICYLKLAEPYDLELTDEQKKIVKQIHNMDLYDDYTVITSDVDMQVNFARAEIPFKYFQNYEWGEKYKLSKVRYEDGIRVFEQGDDSGNTLYINPDNMFIVDQEQINNIYEQVKDLELYSFKGDSIIDPAIDIGDILVIDGKQILYQGSCQYSGRWKASINSEIKSKARQETTVVKKPSQKTINRRVQSSINQIDGKIEQLVEENTETSEKVSKHEQDIDSIKDTVGSMEEFARDLSSYRQLHLTDTADYDENLVLTLKIFGDTEKWKETAPSTLLAPGVTVVPFGTSIDLIVDSQDRLNPSENKKVFTISYGKKLRNVGNVRDELDIINNKVSIIRRIGLNDDGQEYVLDKEQIEELGELKLPTLKDDTYIYVREYPDLEYFCRYIVDNEYIKKFATQEKLQQATVELNTKIEQTNQEIILMVRKKVGKDEVIASINLTPEEVKILANRIKLEGYTTINGGFKVDNNGNMEAVKGKFTGGEFYLYSEDTYPSITVFREMMKYNRPYSSIYPASVHVSAGNSSESKIGMSVEEGEDNAQLYVHGSGGGTWIHHNKINCMGEVWADAYKYNSKVELKENIQRFERSAIDIINNTDIYEFNYKKNKKNKCIGLIIGDGYRASSEIISEDRGVDSYSMNSISWKAIQELDRKIEKVINILKKIPILGRIFTKRWKK